MLGHTAAKTEDNIYGSFCSNPINEAWLIKAIRLFHSNDTESTAKLKQMYKDSCENESKILKISLDEALGRASTSSNTVSNSTTRIRISASASSSSMNTNIQTPCPSKSQQNLSSSTSEKQQIGIQQPGSSTTSIINKTQSSSDILESSHLPVKKPKVTFFNMFDSNKNVPIRKIQPISSISPNAAGGVMDIVASLNCSVCGRMNAPTEAKTLNSSNLLVECTSCGLLYHQLCHKPQILTQVNKDEKWKCTKCKLQI